MPDLSPSQFAILSRLAGLGFSIVAFPMYANYVGIRRGDCAVLLAPDASGFRAFGEPSWLLGGNLSVKIADSGREFFVWKKSRVEATPDRLAALSDFSRSLASALTQSG